MKSKSPKRKKNNQDNYNDYYDTYLKNNFKLGKDSKSKNNNPRTNYQMEGKDFQNKTFFSTELNMVGNKKSSPNKYY